MAPVNPHHHGLVDPASAFVFGLWISMLMAILLVLRDCSSVLTDLPHIHH